MKKLTGEDTSQNVIHNVYPDGLEVPDNMMDPNVGGKINKCRHIFENIGSDICPDCGKNTHEVNWGKQTMLNQKWKKDNPNATYGGWWSI